jgi:hypothetical protein
MTMSPIPDRPMPPPPARRDRAWLLLGATVLGIDLLLAGGIHGDSGVRFDTGVAFAANLADNPVLLLGSTFDRTGCPTVPLAIGSGYSVFCDDWSATTSLDYRAQVVSLYAAGHDVVDAYTGPMPQALRWQEGIAEVKKALGDPSLITDAYGTPTLVYMYTHEPYGSLELRFDTHARLVRINACLTH